MIDAEALRFDATLASDVSVEVDARFADSMLSDAALDRSVLQNDSETMDGALPEDAMTSSDSGMEDASRRNSRAHTPLHLPTQTIYLTRSQTMPGGQKWMKQHTFWMN